MEEEEKDEEVDGGKADEVETIDEVEVKIAKMRRNCNLFSPGVRFQTAFFFSRRRRDIFFLVKFSFLFFQNLRKFPHRL